MRCGSKCFHVEVEIQGVKQIKTVAARSQIDARKTIRTEFGSKAQILSVNEEKKK